MATYSEIKNNLTQGSSEDTLKTLNDIRDRIEIVFTSDYEQFLKNLFHNLIDLLEKYPIQTCNNTAHKIRHLVLSIVHRFPCTSALRTYVKELARACLSCSNDAEENALLALKTLFDLHKTYRTYLETHVAQFIEVILSYYSHVPLAVSAMNRNTLDGSTVEMIGSSDTTKSNTDADDDGSKNKRLKSEEKVKEEEEVLIKANLSFKVLQECPLWTMGLFHLHQSFINSVTPQLVPLMLTTLKINNVHKDSSLFVAQAKTLSFLTYLLRSYAELMTGQDVLLAESVVMLLKSCPTNDTASRKDVLVTMRHILATEFKSGFLPFLDELLHGDILIGSKCHPITRPQTYAALVDLLLQVKSSLTFRHLYHVAIIFCKNLHDESLPIHVQVLSVEIVLSLTDKITTAFGAITTETANLLYLILSSIVRKFQGLSQSIDRIMKVEEVYRQTRSITPAASGVVLANASRAYVSKESKKDAVSGFLLSDYSNESRWSEASMKDTKLLVRNMVWGVRSWLAQVHYLSVTTQEKEEYRDINRKLRALQSDYWRYSLECCRVFECNSALPSIVKTDLDTIDGDNAGADGKNGADSTNTITKDSLELKSALESFIMTWAEPKITLATTATSTPFSGKGPTLPGQATLPQGGMSVPVTELPGMPGKGPSPEMQELIAYRKNLLRELLMGSFQHIFETSIVHKFYTMVFRFLVGEKHCSGVACDITLTFFVERIHLLSSRNVSIESGDEKPKSDSTGRENNEDNAMQITGENDNSATRSVLSPEALENGKRSFLLQKLLKSVLDSLATYPENELMLRPRLLQIIYMCLQRSYTGTYATNYYYVLRGIFRTITRCKLEYSYGEISTSLPQILTAVKHLMSRTSSSTISTYLLELSLLLPARFLSMTAQLPILLDFVSKALVMSGDLPQLALRTFEFWLENLNPSYLHSIMSRVPGLKQAVLSGIATHLRPMPYAYGTLALRILGKLGGYNQDLVRNTNSTDEGKGSSRSRVDFEAYSNHELAVLRVQLGASYSLSRSIRSDENDGEASMDVESNQEDEGVTDTGGDISLSLDTTIIGACSIITKSAIATSLGEKVEVVSAVKNENHTCCSALAHKKNDDIDEGIIEKKEDENMTAAARYEAYLNENASYQQGLFLQQQQHALTVITTALHSLATGSTSSDGSGVQGGQNLRSRLLSKVVTALVVATADTTLREQVSTALSPLFALPSDNTPGSAVLEGVVNGIVILLEYGCDRGREHVLALITTPEQMAYVLSRACALCRGDTFRYRMCGVYIIKTILDAGTPPGNGTAPKALFTILQSRSKGTDPGQLGDMTTLMLDSLISIFEYSVECVVYAGSKDVFMTITQLVRYLTGSDSAGGKASSSKNKSKNEAQRNIVAYLVDRELFHSHHSMVRLVAKTIILSLSSSVDTSTIVDSATVTKRAKEVWSSIDPEDVVPMVKATRSSAKKYTVGPLTKKQRKTLYNAGKDVYAYDLSGMSEAALSTLSSLTYMMKCGLIDLSENIDDQDDEELSGSDSEAGSGSGWQRLIIQLISKACSVSLKHDIVTTEPEGNKSTHTINGGGNTPLPGQSGNEDPGPPPDLSSPAYCRSRDIAAQASNCTTMNGADSSLGKMLLPHNATPYLDEDIQLQVSAFPCVVPRNVLFRYHLIRFIESACADRGILSLLAHDSTQEFESIMAVLFSTYRGGWIYLNTTVSTVIAGIVTALQENGPNNGKKGATAQVRLPDEVMDKSTAVFDPILTGGISELDDVGLHGLICYMALPITVNAPVEELFLSTLSKLTDPGSVTTKNMVGKEMTIAARLVHTLALLPWEMVSNDKTLSFVSRLIPVVYRLHKQRHLYTAHASLYNPCSPQMVLFLTRLNLSQQHILASDEICKEEVYGLVDALLTHTDGLHSSNTISATALNFYESIFDPDGIDLIQSLLDAFVNSKGGYPKETKKARKGAKGSSIQGVDSGKALGMELSTTSEDDPDLLLAVRHVIKLIYSIMQFYNPRLLHDYPQLVIATKFIFQHYLSLIVIASVRTVQHTNIILLEPLLDCLRVLILYCKGMQSNGPGSANQGSKKDISETVDVELALLLSHFFLVDDDLVDTTDIYTFFRFELMTYMSQSNVILLCQRVFNVVPNSTYSAKWRTQLLRMMIIPMLYSVANSPMPFERIITADNVKHFVESLITVMGTRDDDSLRSRDSSISLPPEDALKMISSSGKRGSRDDDDKDDKQGVVRPLLDAAIDSPPYLFADMVDDTYTQQITVQLLKTSSLLLQHMDSSIRTYKRDIIKFSWSNLKNDNISVRYWSYYMISCFIHAIDPTARVTMQIYIQELRAHQQDEADLMRAALSILANTLPRRLNSTEMLKAMRWTRKIANEEGGNLVQLLHLWSAVSSNCDLYFDYRSLFVPAMLSSLNKLGLQSGSGSSSVEYKSVALSIVETILGWETMTRESKGADPEGNISPTEGASSLQSASGSANGGNTDTTTNSTSKKRERASSISSLQEDFSLSASHLQTIVNFLVRLCLGVADARDNNVAKLAIRCVSLLRRVSKQFSLYKIPVPYYERLLLSTLEDCRKGRSEQVALAQQSMVRDGINMSSTTYSLGPLVSTEILSAHILIMHASLGPPSSSTQEGSSHHGNPMSRLVLSSLNQLGELLYAIFRSQNENVYKQFRAFLSLLTRHHRSTLEGAKYGENRLKEIVLDIDHRSEGFYRLLKEEIEAALDTRKLPLHLQSPSSGSHDNTALPIQYTFALSLIRDMTSLLPTHIDAHGTSLVRLTQKLLVGHAQKATQLAKLNFQTLSGSPDVDSDPLSHEMHNATVSVCVFKEMLHHARMESTHQVLGAINTHPSKSNQTNTANTNTAENITTTCTSSFFASQRKEAPEYITEGLVDCILLLLEGVDGGRLEQHTSYITSMMESVLLSSNSSYVSLIVLKYCDKWIGYKHSPLPTKTQLSLFEAIYKRYDRVSERYATFYWSQVALFSLRMCTYMSSYPESISPEKVEEMNPRLTRLLSMVRWAAPASSPSGVGKQDMVGTPGSAGGKSSCSPHAMEQPVNPTLLAPLLMLPDPALRQRIIDTVVPIWLKRYPGKGVYPVLLGLLRCPDRSFGNRYWMSLIPHLFLTSGCSAVQPSAKEGDISIASKGTSKNSTTASFLTSILEVSLIHLDSSEGLQQQLLQHLWSHLDEQKRQALVGELMQSITNMQNKAHQSMWGPDFIVSDTASNAQSILQTLSQLVPVPQIPPEFLSLVGKEFTCVTEAVFLLERMLTASSTDQHVERIQKALVNLLENVDDKDIFLTICTQIKTQVHPESQYLFQLEMAGNSKKAHDVVCAILEKEANQSLLQGTGMKEDIPLGASDHMALLLRRWVSTSKALGHWSALKTFAESTYDVGLETEVSSAMGRWDELRKLRRSPDAILSANNSVENRLNDIVLSLSDAKYSENLTDSLCIQAVQLALLGWQGMGALGSYRKSIRQRNALHLFHRIIELRESANVLIEIQKGQPNPKLTSDFTKLMDSWTNRIPVGLFGDMSQMEDDNNHYFPKMLSIIGTPVVTSWDILLKWRRCIVKIAEDLLKKSARYDMANSLSVTGDISIWTLHQNIVNSRSGTTVSRSIDRKSLPAGAILPSNETQARRARTDFELLKSKLVGCLSLSTSEKPPSSPIKRAVNRVVEGVDSQVALSPRPATSLVNSDGTVKTADPADLTQELDFAAAAVSALLQAEACKTLSSFSSSQRSEIYRLKGIVYARLGQHQEASSAFSDSLQISDTYSKSWLSWAQYLYNSTGSGTVESSGSTSSSPAKGPLSVSTITSAGVHVTGSVENDHMISVCILKAAECNAEASRFLLVRVLHYLEYYYTLFQQESRRGKIDGDADGDYTLICQTLLRFIDRDHIPTHLWYSHIDTLMRILVLISGDNTKGTAADSKGAKKKEKNDENSSHSLNNNNPAYLLMEKLLIYAPQHAYQHIAVCREAYTHALMRDNEDSKGAMGDNQGTKGRYKAVLSTLLSLETSLNAKSAISLAKNSNVVSTSLSPAAQQCHASALFSLQNSFYADLGKRAHSVHTVSLFLHGLIELMQCLLDDNFDKRRTGSCNQGIKKVDGTYLHNAVPSEYTTRLCSLIERLERALSMQEIADTFSPTTYVSFLKDMGVNHFSKVGTHPLFFDHASSTTSGKDNKSHETVLSAMHKIRTWIATLSTCSGGSGSKRPGGIPHGGLLEHRLVVPGCFSGLPYESEKELPYIVKVLPGTLDSFDDDNHTNKPDHHGRCIDGVLRILGSDGVIYRYKVVPMATDGASITARQARTTQHLLSYMNWCLTQYSEASRRELLYHPRQVLPLNSHYSLMKLGEEGQIWLAGSGEPQNSRTKQADVLLVAAQALASSKVSDVASVHAQCIHYLLGQEDGNDDKTQQGRDINICGRATLGSRVGTHRSLLVQSGLYTALGVLTRALPVGWAEAGFDVTRGAMTLDGLRHDLQVHTEDNGNNGVQAGSSGSVPDSPRGRGKKEKKASGGTNTAVCPTGGNVVLRDPTAGLFSRYSDALSALESPSLEKVRILSIGTVFDAVLKNSHLTAAVLTEYYLNQLLPDNTIEQSHCPIHRHVYSKDVTAMSFHQALPQAQRLVKECIEQVGLYAPNAVIASSHSNHPSANGSDHLALPYSFVERLLQELNGDDFSETPLSYAALS